MAACLKGEVACARAAELLMLDSCPTTVHDRIVSNDNVVQWDGRRFQIPPQPNASASPAPESNSVNHIAKPSKIYYGDSKLHHAGLLPGLGVLPARLP